MEQRVKKAKLFRTLKVIYYCLGFPVFILAVFMLASQNLGHNPFVGNGEGVMGAVWSFFKSPAMYAVWIAFGIWLVIGLVQIICKFAIKNRRTRAMVVVAIMLVVLLVPMFAIDAIYTAKIDELMTTAPAGTSVRDYKYQLSYYRTQTSSGQLGGGTRRESLTDVLKNNVYEFCKVYNISMFTGMMGGKSSGNFTNEALYYDVLNFDYNEDGVVDSYDHILIRNPIAEDAKEGEYGVYWATSLKLESMTGANEEEIQGNFYAVTYTQAVSPDKEDDVVCYVWYDGDKAAFAEVDGIYGVAYYNKNGMLGDGYFYNVEVALNILEAYYQAQEDMAALFAKTGKTDEAAFRKEIEKDAAKRQEDYYLESGDETLVALWEREQAYAAGYSLTTDELNAVLRELGGALGSAKLLESLLPTVESLIGGLKFSVGQILGLVLGDMPETMNFLTAQLSDLANIKLAIKWNNNLQIVLEDLPGGAEPVVIDLNKSFSVASVKKLLDGLGISNNLLAEVIGLLGLQAQGAENTTEGLEEMLGSLLESLYWYKSPVLLPEYDFYVDETLDETDEKQAAIKEYQAAYSAYKRAEYEGGAHGYMAGSRLIGSTLGDGTYGAEFGLQSLAEVRQLQLDLSYQPTMYSILIVRDMLMTFAAFILFFTMMSYIAADREILWATGQIDPNKGKKAKKGKKAEKAEENNKEVA